MIEVAVAAQAAFKAYSLLKSGIDRGKEIEDMSATVRRFFDAKHDINKAVEKEEKRQAKYGLEEGSTLGEAIDYIEEQERIAKLEDKIKWMYINQGKSATWAKIKRESERRQKKRESDKRKALKKQSTDSQLVKTLLLIFTFIGLGMVGIAGILFLIIKLGSN